MEKKRDILGVSCWAVNHPLQDAPSKNVVNVIRVHDSSSKSDAVTQCKQQPQMLKCSTCKHAVHSLIQKIFLAFAKV